jgi:hypothetical protein
VRRRCRYLLRSQRCSGTCSDSGRPLKSMKTLASEHTSSFLYASQYIVPHSEQHCSSVLVQKRHCIRECWTNTCSSISLSNTLSIFFMNSCRRIRLHISNQKDFCSPCCGGYRARRQHPLAPTTGEAVRTTFRL